MTWKEIADHASIMVTAYTDPTDKLENAQWKWVDDILYIAGTNDVSDWKDNLTVSTTVLWCGIVHTGFHDYAESIIRAHNSLDPELIVGHSLGGAAAQILGAMLKKPCLTFGSPRPWHKDGTVQQHHHTRVYNRGDPVPHVPGLCRWKHVSQDDRPVGWPISWDRIKNAHWMGRYRDLAAALS